MLKIYSGCERKRRNFFEGFFHVKRLFCGFFYAALLLLPVFAFADGTPAQPAAPNGQVQPAETPEQPAASNGQVLPAESQAKPLAAKDLVLPLVKLDYKWKKVWYGRTVKLNFTLDNQSSSDVEGIVITCAFKAKDGTQFGVGTRKFFDIVPRKTCKEYKGEKIGFLPYAAACADCKVVDLAICEPAASGEQAAPPCKAEKE